MLRRFSSVVVKKPYYDTPYQARPSFKRADEMKGLTLQSVAQMVADTEQFTLVDRNFASYRLDICLRVMHDHFKKDQQAGDHTLKIQRARNQLNPELIGEIFLNMQRLMGLCSFKSSQISHMTYLAHILNYQNIQFMILIDQKICSQKVKGGQVFTAATLRNFFTVMAYNDQHTFSDESWRVITEHFTKYLETVDEVTQKNFVESCMYCLNKHKEPLSSKLLDLCERQLQLGVDCMTLSNKITLAGIFAKNSYLGPFFFYVLQHIQQTPLQKMLQSNSKEGVDLKENTQTKQSPNYEKFGFEQAALLLNCLRAARKQDVKLLTKLQDYVLLREGQLEVVKNQDLSLIVYGFGMLEFGSEPLWSALTQQVTNRFEKLSTKDLDMILQGFQSDIPFEKGTPKLYQMIQQSIMDKFNDPENFVVAANTFIGRHTKRGTDEFWQSLETKFQEYMKVKERTSVFIAQYLKLLSKYKSDKIPSEVYEQISRDIKNFSKLDDICSIHLSLSTLLPADSVTLLKVRARVVRNVDRMSHEQAYYTLQGQKWAEDKREALIAQIIKNNLNLKFVQSLTISLVKNEIFEKAIWDKIVQTLKTEMADQDTFQNTKYWEVCIRGLKAANLKGVISADFLASVQKAANQLF